MTQELLLLPFYEDIIDKSGRHALYDSNEVTFETDSLGVTSASFNGVSYLTTANDTNYLEDGSKGYTAYTLSQIGNGDDFLLGSTKHITTFTSGNFEVVYPDNNFTIDAWVYMKLGSARYYPICSSYSIGYSGLPLKIGWSLQVDTASGHLQMIHYKGGDYTSCVLESSLQVPFNNWTHIAVMSWVADDESGPEAQAIFINGHPDHSYCYYNSLMRFGNGYFPASDINTHQFGAFYVGLGPKSQFTNPGQSWLYDLNPLYSNYFRGNISNLRICLGQRFPLSGEYPIVLQAFSPPGNLPTTTTTTTASTTSGTTTVPVTWSTTTLSSTSTSTGSTTTGTTLTYTTTTTWTSTTVTYATTTPVPPKQRISTGGTASASDYFEGYGPSKAFDSSSSTYWMCNPYYNPPCWIEYFWPGESYAVDEYQLFLTTTGNPKSWLFQGSNDGSTWVTLDTQEDVATTGLLSFPIDNTTEYNRYRLYVTEIWSQSYGIKVSELDLFINSATSQPESLMHWLGYDFGTPTLIQRYCMNTTDQSGFTEWKLQGSDDGVFWADIDYQIQPEWVGWKCIEIEDNDLSFPRWRLLIINWNSTANPGLVEFEVFRRP